MDVKFESGISELPDLNEIKVNLQSEVVSACEYYGIQASNLFVSISKDERPIALEFDIKVGSTSVMHVRYTLMGARAAFYMKV